MAVPVLNRLTTVVIVVYGWVNRNAVVGWWMLNGWFGLLFWTKWFDTSLWFTAGFGFATLILGFRLLAKVERGFL